MGDQFTWTGAGDGQSWSDPNNWNDVTASQDPATTAPGSGDAVEFDIDATLTGGGECDTLDAEATLTVDGASISTTSSMSIGLSGTGEMDIDSGATVTAGSYFQIGGLQGATGTVDVDGIGTTLTADDVITVGGSGDGTLTVFDDATVTTEVGFEIGWSALPADAVGSGKVGIIHVQTAMPRTVRSRSKTAVRSRWKMITRRRSRPRMAAPARSRLKAAIRASLHRAWRSAAGMAEWVRSSSTRGAIARSRCQCDITLVRRPTSDRRAATAAFPRRVARLIKRWRTASSSAPSSMRGAQKRVDSRTTSG